MENSPQEHPCTSHKCDPAPRGQLTAKIDRLTTRFGKYRLAAEYKAAKPHRDTNPELTLEEICAIARRHHVRIVIEPMAKNQ